MEIDMVRKTKVAEKPAKKEAKVAPVKKPRQAKAQAIVPDGMVVAPKFEGTYTVTGNYSTSTYNNGDLISFDIDWDRLKEHLRKVG